jgi:hypothetical protein
MQIPLVNPAKSSQQTIIDLVENVNSKKEEDAFANTINEEHNIDCLIYELYTA